MRRFYLCARRKKNPPCTAGFPRDTALPEHAEIEAETQYHSNFAHHHAIKMYPDSEDEPTKETFTSIPTSSHEQETEPAPFCSFDKNGGGDTCSCLGFVSMEPPGVIWSLEPCARCGHRREVHSLSNTKGAGNNTAPRQPYLPSNIIAGADWYARVSLLPSADITRPFAKSSTEYLRLESRGLNLHLKIPGHDGDSIRTTISIAFKDALQGRPWMPLRQETLAPGDVKLSKISSRQLRNDHDFEFLLENCLSQSKRSNTTLNLYIAPSSYRMTWQFIRGLPRRDDYLEEHWKLNLIDDDDIDPSPSDGFTMNETRDVAQAIQRVQITQPNSQAVAARTSQSPTTLEVAQTPAANLSVAKGPVVTKGLSQYPNLKPDVNGHFPCPYSDCWRHKTPFRKSNLTLVLEHLRAAHNVYYENGAGNSGSLLPPRQGMDPAALEDSANKAAEDPMPQPTATVPSTLEPVAPLEQISSDTGGNEAHPSEGTTGASRTSEFSTDVSDSDSEISSRLARKTLDIVLEIINNRKNALVQRVVAEFVRQIRNYDGLVSCPAGDTSTTGTPNATISAGPSTSGPFRLPKRKRNANDCDSNGLEDESGDDEGDGVEGKPERTAPKRFACHFFKHNPEEYASSRTCLGPGFGTIRRVK